jgi:hypothetical protein
MQLCRERLQSDNVEDKATILEEEKRLSEKVKRFEKAEQREKIDVGDDFYKDLCNYIDGLPAQEFGTRGGKIFVIQAEFQADAVMAHRLVNKISDIVLCADSDLASLTGEECVSIKDFKYSNKEITQIEVFFAFESTMLKTRTLLLIDEDTPNITINNPECPIFDEIKSFQLRALISVGLGCDVFTFGIKFLKKADLNAMVKSRMESVKDPLVLFDEVVSFLFEKYWKQQRTNSSDPNIKLETKTQFTNAINIFVQSIIYEPANYNTPYNEIAVDNNQNIYIYNNVPRTLHRYVEAFARGNIGEDAGQSSIYGDEDSLCTCVGPGNGKHLFLKFEGVSLCQNCNRSCCYSCIFGATQLQPTHCIDCFMEEMTIPNSVLTENIPIDTMRRSLLEDRNIDIPSNMEISEIMDLYDAVFNNTNFLYNPQMLQLASPLPLEKSSYINELEEIISFDIKNGGSFLRNPNLTNKDKIDILNIMAGMVELYTKDEIKDLDFRDTKLYTVVPKMYVEFAQRSRVHGGYRLLKRAVRHAMDPATPGILDTNGRVVYYNNQVSLQFSQVIRASMKKDKYKVKVTFNNSGIVCCGCDCKAGGYNNDKIICVHILPVLLQYTILLFDGLAEHVLYEMANEWYTFETVQLSNGLLEVLYAALQKLLSASSRSVSSIDLQIDAQTMRHKIIEILNIFKVGTLEYKPGPGPPNPNTLGPLLNYDKRTPASKIENIYNNRTRSSTLNSTEGINIAEVSSSEEIEYDKIHHLMKMAKEWFGTDECLESFVGYRVIKLRCDNQLRKLSGYKKTIIEVLNAGSSPVRHPPVRNGANCVYYDESDSNDDAQSSSSDTDSEYEYYEEEVDEELEDVYSTEEDDEDDQYYNINDNAPKRKSCCVPDCCITSTIYPEATFRRVPNVPVKKELKKLNDPSDKKKITDPNKLKSKNNNLLKNYYKNVFQREEWMLRLGLPKDCPYKWLDVCNRHKIEKQKLDYFWKDLDDATLKATEFIKVPIGIDVPDILKTRAQTSIRKEAPMRKIGKRKYSCKSKKTVTVVKKKIPKLRHCAYVNCTNNSRGPNRNLLKWICVPCSPKCDEYDVKYFYQPEYIARRKMYRREFLRRMGQPTNTNNQHLRICNFHGVDRTFMYAEWKTKNGKKDVDKVWMDVPSSYAVKSSMNQLTNATISKGTAREQKQKRDVENYEAVYGKTSGDMELWRTYETNRSEGELHQSVAEALGVEQDFVAKMKQVKYGIVSEPTYFKKTKYRQHGKPTVYRLRNMPKNYIKRNTGFSSEYSLICFIIILCNGDLDMMGSHETNMTWVEEWLFFFEFLYGRNIKRWCDAVYKFKKSELYLRQIFSNKMKILNKCRINWPKYLTFKEDLDLRGPRWDSSYSDKRIVFWDNTDIRIVTPSDADVQRNTYSAYYAGNVAKGGVFIQPSGWMGTHDLWMGAVSDSEYFIRSGILKQQQEFLDTHDPDTKEYQWINILDKGFRVVEAAWREGRQFVLQPTFAKADKKFTSKEIIRSSTVASDRGGNERAVRLAKMCGFLENGMEPTQNMNIICDAWLGWGFICNFIYASVFHENIK